LLACVPALRSIGAAVPYPSQAEKTFEWARRARGTTADEPIDFAEPETIRSVFAEQPAESVSSCALHQRFDLNACPGAGQLIEEDVSRGELEQPYDAPEDELIRWLGTFVAQPPQDEKRSRPITQQLDQVQFTLLQFSLPPPLVVLDGNAHG
jgi:hypothetical protein